MFCQFPAFLQCNPGYIIDLKSVWSYQGAPCNPHCALEFTVFFLVCASQRTWKRNTIPSCQSSWAVKTKVKSTQPSSLGFCVKNAHLYRENFGKSVTSNLFCTSVVWHNTGLFTKSGLYEVIVFHFLQNLLKPGAATCQKLQNSNFVFQAKNVGF